MKNKYLILLVLLAVIMVVSCTDSGENTASQVSSPQNYDSISQNEATTSIKLEDINDPKKLYEYGNELSDAGSYELSIEYFDKSLSIRYNEKVLNRKARALFHLHKYEDAIECADSVLKNNTTNTVALGIKGASLAELGDFDQGIKYIDMAIEADPDNQPLIEIKNKINTYREQQEKAQIDVNSNDQYYNLRFEDYTDLAGGRVLYAYANSYDASEAKANSLAEACGSGPKVRSKYDAVMVYLTDLNTGVQYEGDYKITDFYG